MAMGQPVRREIGKKPSFTDTLAQGIQAYQARRQADKAAQMQQLGQVLPALAQRGNLTPVEAGTPGAINFGGMNFGYQQNPQNRLANEQTALENARIRQQLANPGLDLMKSAYGGSTGMMLAMPGVGNTPEEQEQYKQAMLDNLAKSTEFFNQRFGVGPDGVSVGIPGLEEDIVGEDDVIQYAANNGTTREEAYASLYALATKDPSIRLDPRLLKKYGRPVVIQPAKKVGQK